MMSPVSFMVMLLIMIIIPTLLYSFFFLISCPPSPFELLRRYRSTINVENFDQRRSKMAEGEEDEATSNKDKNNIELVIASSSKLGKDAECPVCLAVFIEGEELRQLNLCKHLFHRSCIDKWLASHCNCPVCRAFVGNGQSKAIKERENARGLASRDVGRHDFWQGLPDSAGLV